MPRRGVAKPSRFANSADRHNKTGGTMRFGSLNQLIAQDRAALAKGPVALLFIEDMVELASTLEHLDRSGFRTIVCLLPRDFAFPDELTRPNLRLVSYDVFSKGAVPHVVNKLIAAAPGTWFHYCFNAEYLFFPFCETRRIGEMLSFHAEERRDAMLTYVIDIYAADLAAHPNAVDRATAHLDRSGYYAQARKGPNGNPKERQLDFHGGLRWRFEEHVAANRRRIDRIGLFRAARDLRMRADHTFEVEEYNTYTCPWHHSLTAAICSFRAAKALATNPGSRHDIQGFLWRNSEPFRWESGQLMELGLIEPGQWF